MIVFERSYKLQRVVLGTYNNQYMVLDLKKVRLGQAIDDNALWVIEQIPGLVVGADQTPTLRTGTSQCNDRLEMCTVNVCKNFLTI